MDESGREKLVRGRIFNTIADCIALETNISRKTITEKTEISCDVSGVKVIWRAMQCYHVQTSFHSWHKLTVGELVDMAIEVIRGRSIVTRDGITMM